MSRLHRAFRTKGSNRVFDTMPALSKIFVQSQAICDSRQERKRVCRIFHFDTPCYISACTQGAKAVSIRIYSLLKRRS
ncbi:Uncharacterised protein [Porphyromonas cangingivalis]|nr:Uncharacterised protein [Porphyromonas cangingivalis]